MAGMQFTQIVFIQQLPCSNLATLHECPYLFCVFISAINPLRRGINFMEGIMKKEEKKEVRAVQYEVTQEMADTLRKLSDIGADISLLICSFRFLGDFVLDNHFIDETSRDTADGWYQSHTAAIDKLEAFARDVEILPRALECEFERAIEAVHGEDKRDSGIWKKDTPEVVDRLSALSMEMRDILGTITLRIDEERKAQAAAA